MSEQKINGLGLPYGIKSPNKMYATDAYAGPYNTIQDALDSIPSEIRVPGRKVGVYLDLEKKQVDEYVFIINSNDDWELVKITETYDINSNTFSNHFSVNNKFVDLNIKETPAHAIRKNINFSRSITGVTNYGSVSYDVLTNRINIINGDTIISTRTSPIPVGEILTGITYGDDFYGYMSNNTIKIFDRLDLYQTITTQPNTIFNLIYFTDYYFIYEIKKNNGEYILMAYEILEDETFVIKNSTSPSKIKSNTNNLNELHIINQEEYIIYTLDERRAINIPNNELFNVKDFFFNLNSDVIILDENGIFKLAGNEIIKIIELNNTNSVTYSINSRFIKGVPGKLSFIAIQDSSGVSKNVLITINYTSLKYEIRDILNASNLNIGDYEYYEAPKYVEGSIHLYNHLDTTILSNVNGVLIGFNDSKELSTLTLNEGVGEKSIVTGELELSGYFNGIQKSVNNRLKIRSTINDLGFSSNFDILEKDGYVQLATSTIYNNIRGNNTYYGVEALSSIFSNSTTVIPLFNTAIGDGTLKNLYSGAGYNTSLGFEAGVNLNTGIYNTFIGYRAGLGIRNGNYNTIIGPNPTISTLNDTIHLYNGKGRLGFSVVENGLVTIPTQTNALITSNDKAVVTKGYLNDNHYTKTQVDSKLSGVYKFKGSVSSVSNLPSSGNSIGDVYNVTDTDMNYGWTGSTWDALGSTYVIPTLVSELTNDVGYIKLIDIDGKLDKPSNRTDGSHINVVVVDSNGNSATKPLDEFGQSEGEPNIITSIKMNGTPLEIIDKAVNIEIDDNIQPSISSSDGSIYIESGDIKINITQTRENKQINDPNLILPFTLTYNNDFLDIQSIFFNGVLLDNDQYQIVKPEKTITVNSLSKAIKSLFLYDNEPNKISIFGTTKISIT